MMNPFERFYDTKIDVYAAEENEYEKRGQKNLLGTVVCDIQPYRSDTESKPYGLSENVSYKLFCDKNDLMKTGRYVSFAGAWYMIATVEIWSFGMTVMIRSCDDAC